MSYYLLPGQVDLGSVLYLSGLIGDDGLAMKSVVALPAVQPRGGAVRVPRMRVMGAGSHGPGLPTDVTPPTPSPTPSPTPDPTPIPDPTPTPPPTPLPIGVDLAYYPFENTLWKLPIGSWNPVLVDDLRTSALRSANLYLNATNGYGIPVFYAVSTDPLENLDSADSASVTFNAPTNLGPTTGSDGNFVVIDPTHSFDDECWIAVPETGGWYATSHERIRLDGNGMSGGIRAADWSLLGGLIRTWEMEPGVPIQHALVMAIKVSTARRGWIYPANSEDYNNSGYAGSIPLGSFFAIPGSVDLSQQGFTPEGYKVAKACQDYGVYVGDTAGQHAFFGEQSLAQAKVDAVISDLSTIRGLLRVTSTRPPTL